MNLSRRRTANRFPVYCVLLLNLAFLSGVACTKRQVPEGGSQTQVAGVSPKTLNVAAWANYLPDELIHEFETQTQIKVTVSNYSSNEELLSKLQAGGSVYDVAIPSDYMVFAMRKLGLLLPIDPLRTANRKNLDPSFLNKGFDPSNENSLPLDWGTTGIAYSPSLCHCEIKSLKDLYSDPKISGHLSLLDDGREALGSALKLLGFSLNSHDPQQWEQAKKLLIAQRKRLRAFNTDTKVPLVNGEVWAAQAYSSDALQAAAETSGKVIYVIPTEGATLWLDNLVIPKGAKNIESAHRFIDFMLEPKSALATTKLFLDPVNQAAYDLIDPALKKNPSYWVSPQVRARLEMMEDLGEAAPLVGKLWTEVKASGD